MVTTDPRVDDYIAKAAAFARPILTELRARVHAACPEVVETIKWGMPAFDYRGPLAGLAAFKAHCAFWLWKHELILGHDTTSRSAMGSFGKLTKLADLPGRRDFTRWLKQAMKLNEQGIKAPRSKRARPAKATMHPEFRSALAAKRTAQRTFDAMAPSRRREYVEWIADAKQEGTRARRIEQAVQWLAEGKNLHWKYERRPAGKVTRSRT